jgi:hypothetical protein
MERTYDFDSPIVYVDPKGVRHSALATTWWGLDHHKAAGTQPGCNLLWVSGDETKTDPYGRQIERATSVVHKSSNPAPGNYWCWPDE